MSKLFKLKEWLTVAETARYLSNLFVEAVTEADVLRLALDRRLQLSVRFVNPVLAVPGKLIPIGNAKYKEVPSLDGTGTVRLYGGPTLVTEGIETHVVELEKTVSTLLGVYDLPLIGDELLDIEHKFQSLTLGPAVTLQGLDGAFVKGRDERLCQLQTCFDDNELGLESKARLEQMKQHIADADAGSTKAETAQNQHQKVIKKFLDRDKPRPAYYPASGLPHDSELIVRTAAIAELETSIRESEELGTAPEADKPVSTRERNTLLSILAAACEEAKLDHSKAAKTAGVLCKRLDEMGISVGDTTIEGHLKKIPDALRSRMK